MKLIESLAIIILDKVKLNWIWRVFTVYIGGVVSGGVGRYNQIWRYFLSPSFH